MFITSAIGHIQVGKNPQTLRSGFFYRAMETMVHLEDLPISILNSI